MIKTELYAHLTANVPAVAGRIYPVLLPQNPTYPAITYRLISDPREYSLDGADGLVEARYQIEAWAKLESQVDAIVEVIRLAMNAFVGVFGLIDVSRARNVGGVDLYDPEVEVHHTAVDYLIRYAEA